MKDDLNKLLQKKMDRKGFLKHVGIGLAAMTGVATILKTLTGAGNTQQQARGYGGGAYGGQPSGQSANRKV